MSTIMEDKDAREVRQLVERFSSDMLTNMSDEELVRLRNVLARVELAIESSGGFIDETRRLEGDLPFYTT